MKKDIISRELNRASYHSKRAPTRAKSSPRPTRARARAPVRSRVSRPSVVRDTTKMVSGVVGSTATIMTGLAATSAIKSMLP